MDRGLVLSILPAGIVVTLVVVVASVQPRWQAPHVVPVIGALLLLTLAIDGGLTANTLPTFWHLAAWGTPAPVPSPGSLAVIVIVPSAPFGMCHVPSPVQAILVW